MRGMVVLSLLVNSPMMKTVFASSQGCAEDVSSWKIIYEKDANGKIISGTLTALMNAFKKGMNIKVLNHAGAIVEITHCVDFVKKR